MSFYERRVLPPLLDLAMRNREVTRYRQQVIPGARGTTLEIGAGSGLNLRFYGTGVERLIAVDPSEALMRIARERAHGAAYPVEFLVRGAENLSLEAASVDTVVLTFTLCTIADPAKALREAHRVLRPGGALIFAEHGLAPDENVRRWQRRINPLWSRIAGGCNLDRRIDELIVLAGFRLAGMETGYAKGPRPMSYIYAGRARPV